MSSITVTGRISPPIAIPVVDKGNQEIAELLSGEITAETIATAQELFFTIYPVVGPHKMRKGEEAARALLLQARQTLYLKTTVPVTSLSRAASAAT